MTTTTNTDRRPPEGRVPDLLLEQLALGELDAARAAAVRRRIEADPSAAARFEALTQSDADILAAYPPAAQVAAIDAQRAVTPRAQPTAARPRRAWLIPALGAAIAAAIALLVIVPGDPSTVAGDGPGASLDDGGPIRAKGDPRFSIYRQRGGEAERLDAGAVVGAGDVLQLRYIAAGRPFGALLSIDGRGEVILHQPTRADAPPSLASGGEVTVPFGYALDDAPGFERFFFVTSPERFDLAAVVTAAEDLARSPTRGRSGALTLPDGLAQRDLLLRKPEAQR